MPAKFTNARAGDTNGHSSSGWPTIGPSEFVNANAVGRGPWLGGVVDTTVAGVLVGAGPVPGVPGTRLLPRMAKATRRPTARTTAALATARTGRPNVIRPLQEWPDACCSKTTDAGFRFRLSHEVAAGRAYHRRHERATVICPDCGTENAAGSRFCDECGATLSAACPNCGEPHRPGAKFCANCGTALT